MRKNISDDLQVKICREKGREAPGEKKKKAAKDGLKDGQEENERGRGIGQNSNLYSNQKFSNLTTGKGGGSTTAVGKYEGRQRKTNTSTAQSRGLSYRVKSAARALMKSLLRILRDDKRSSEEKNSQRVLDI